MLSLVFSLIGRILAWLINAYITVLFVRMILDWVSVLARNWYPRGVVAQLINIVYSITEPPLRWLRFILMSASLCCILRWWYWKVLF